MPTKKLRHDSHRITVRTFRNNGRWIWQFQIDEEKPVTFLRSPAQDEVEARAEALAAARSIVDLRKS